MKGGKSERAPSVEEEGRQMNCGYLSKRKKYGVSLRGKGASSMTERSAYRGLKKRSAETLGLPWGVVYIKGG